MSVDTQRAVNPRQAADGEKGHVLVGWMIREDTLEETLSDRRWWGEVSEGMWQGGH